MLTINEKPPAFASRAVGLIEGRLALHPADGPNAITITTDDGAVIPGSAQSRPIEMILADPSLLGERVRCLVYPRTEKTLLRVQIVSLELAAERSPQSDLFLIQGWNLGSRRDNLAQVGIRPNRKSKHQFERFWISLHGRLTDNLKCVYQVRAIRKGRRLFIIQSDPQLPRECLIPSEKKSSLHRRPGSRI